MRENYSNTEVFQLKQIIVAFLETTAVNEAHRWSRVVNTQSSDKMVTSFQMLLAKVE